MKIGIIGAGVSGLSTAHFLRQNLKKSQKKGEITIFEKSSRIGGAVWTNQSALNAQDPSKQFLFEWGPRGVRPKGPRGRETLSLVHHLDLESEIAFSDSAASKRFLLMNGKLEPLPSGITSAFTSATTRPYLKDMATEWMKPKKETIYSSSKNQKSQNNNNNNNNNINNYEDDESVYDFFSRRFSENMAFTLATPLVSGIYSGDARSLSIRSCFPSLYDMEQQSGSITRGIIDQMLRRNTHANPSTDEPFIPEHLLHESKGKALMSFKNGMETLTDNLAAKLQSSNHTSVRDHNTRGDSSFQAPVSLWTGNGVAAMTFNADRSVSITSDTGEVHQFDHVVAAVPAPVLSRVLKEGRTLHNSLSLTSGIRSNIDDLAQTLGAIEMGSIAVANFGIAGANIIPPSLRGFGYLIPGFHAGANHSNGESSTSSASPQTLNDADDMVLGAIMDSCTFPSQNRHSQETRITVMLRPPYSSKEKFDRQEVLRKASAAVTRHLNLAEDADHHYQNNDPMYLFRKADYADVEYISPAIAQYNVGHHQRVRQVESYLQNNARLRNTSSSSPASSLLSRNDDDESLGSVLSVVGSSYHGVGVNDCVTDARQVANRIIY